jgi:hypothetical protein
VPGGAGGARATPLNSLPSTYGSSMGTRVKGADGAAFILLTTAL